MAEMPKRDTVGKCEGECADRVSELEKKQQEKLDEAGMESSVAETPTVEDATQRKRAPGDMGGHV